MRAVGMAVAAVVAVVVWHFAISPVWFLVGGAVVGLLYAAYCGKEVKR
jgi:chromate transport protein ChrA